MYFYPAYKNFDDLESHLTQGELIKLYEKAFERDMDNKRFTAAMQGIDLDGNSDKKSKFDEIKRRAEAKAAGMSEEQYELQGMFDIIDE